MRNKENLCNLYKSFCEAEGSHHIASEFAIKKINCLVNKFNVKRILEIGLGIGSISGIILALNRNKRVLEYVGTEANEFCLKVLPENLKEDFNGLHVYSDLSNFALVKKFELIIIDGQDANLSKLKNLLSKNGIIAIEGDRIKQQDLLQELFPNHKYVHLISKDKTKRYSPFPSTQWQGGLKIIFINPTGNQNLWWLKEKVLTKMKYLLFR